MIVSHARAQEILEGLQDIYTPLFMAVNRWIILLVLLLLIVLIALAIKYFLKHRTRAKASNVEPLKPAHVIAYEALEKLRQSNFIESGKYKEFYSTLSGIVRRYLEAQFGIQAPEMTTEEFLHALSSSESLLFEHKMILERFLRGCDLVKFAKYGPSALEMNESFEIAKTLVDRTKPETVNNEEVK